MAGLDSISFVLGVVGALPVLAGVWYWLQGVRRGRRLLRFSRTSPVDIVLTTSAVAPAVHGLAVHRPMTGYGQTRAVASCSRALTSLYPKKDVLIHLSGFIRNRLTRDLIAVGGPAKNEASRSILEGLGDRYQFDRFLFDDERDHLLVDAGDKHFALEGFSPEIVDGYPTSDFGLIIVMDKSTGDGRRSRSMFCAGLTTYGTAAAAEYLFVDLVRRSRRVLRRRGDGREFMIVVHARFSRGECTEITPVFELVLTRKRT